MTRATAAILLAAACAHLASAPPTKYRTGDFVVYRYSGLFSRLPVLLREEVVAQRGNRLSIEVTARRGDEERRWVQVVEDTPGNRAANRVEELVELKDGKRIRLENRDNRDLVQLYEWTLIFPEGPATDRRLVPCSDRVEGQSFSCECVSARVRMMGHPVEIVERSCADFLWTHSSSLARDMETGDVIQKVEVVQAGNTGAP